MSDDPHARQAADHDLAAPTPAPGSDEAIAAGCQCPVLDNAHGAGCGTDENGQTVYVMVIGCPVHHPTT